MTDTPNILQQLLDMQEDLQIKSYDGNSPMLLEGEARVDFIRWNVLALTDELHELLAETGWKPWATSKHVNEKAAQGELIDALHFFLNLALALKMTADDLADGYARKHQKNADRQTAGYDGVSTKCPECKRALDDDAVTCYLVGPNHYLQFYSYGGKLVTGHYCEKFGRFYPDEDPS